MKKIAGLIAAGALLLSAATVLAAKPDSPPGLAEACTTIQDGTLLTSDGNVIATGFDEWGYNYQGRFFNGLYCDSYRDAAWCQPYKDVNLMMKWNDAWLSNKDCEGDGLLDRHFGFPSYIGSGAWLTNHQSGEYEDAGEMCKWNYFVKIVAAPADAHTLWNLEGDWAHNGYYGGNTYSHEWTVESQVGETFSGTGNYVGDPSVTWTFVGTVDGDDITINIDYDNSAYWVELIGTIDSNGEIDGTWVGPGQSGEWETTSGTATRYWHEADGTEIGPEIWGAFAIIQQVENDSCAGLHGQQYISPTRAGLGNW